MYEQGDQLSGEYPPCVNQVFVELMTLGPYSTFGEVAALKGARRGASVISNSYTELLVLTR